MFRARVLPQLSLERRLLVRHTPVSFLRPSLCPLMQPARTWASERPATLLDKYGREIQRLDNSSSSSGKYRRFGEGKCG